MTGSAINWLYSLNQPSAQQNISAQFGTPNPFNVNGAPYLLNVGYQSVQFHGIVPRSEYTQIISGEQNYTLVKGRHQIQFGGRYRQETLDTIPDRPDQSDLDFGSSATALYNPATGTAFGTAPQTGDNAANFFLGVAGRYAQQRPPGAYNMTRQGPLRLRPGQLEGHSESHRQSRRPLAVPRTLSRQGRRHVAVRFPQQEHRQQRADLPTGPERLHHAADRRRLLGHRREVGHARQGGNPA